MNILLQVAGFFVMIVIFIFYFYDRDAAVKSNRLFLYQSIAITISIFLDIFSIVMFNTPELTYSGLAYGSGKLYLVSCLTVAFFGLFYVLGDSYLSKKLYVIIKYTAITLLIIGIILSLSLRLDITYDPDGLNDFTGGPSVTVTYIITFIFMFSTLIIAIINRHKMYKKRLPSDNIYSESWEF